MMKRGRVVRYGLVLLLLLSVSYCTYEVHKTFQPPPIAEGKVPTGYRTDNDEIAKAFTAVLRKHFPVGTTQTTMMKELESQGFRSPQYTNNCGVLTESMKRHTPRNYITCPFYNPAKSLYYNWHEPIFICVDKLGVGWETDSKSRIVQIDGYRWRDCP
jgi:hypothetical protein